MGQPIVQFGTSRFLLAHVALFVSQAEDPGPVAQALGHYRLGLAMSRLRAACRIWVDPDDRPAQTLQACLGPVAQGAVASGKPR